jgi:hypothetical protein
VLSVALLSGCQQSTPNTKTIPKPALAEEIPTAVSITDLSRNPSKFDGRLVLVRARLAFGWEGDNFLFDPSAAVEKEDVSHRSPSVWFYCKPGQRICSAISPDNRPVLGTFMGYFHFVPDQKSRMNDVFDPGPLQLEAIGVSVEDPLFR